MFKKELLLLAFSMQIDIWIKETLDYLELLESNEIFHFVNWIQRLKIKQIIIFVDTHIVTISLELAVF